MFADESFDAIISSNGIEFVTDLDSGVCSSGIASCGPVASR